MALRLDTTEGIPLSESSLIHEFNGKEPKKFVLYFSAVCTPPPEPKISSVFPHLGQAKDAILAGADSILLDEFDPELLKKNIKEFIELSRNRANRIKSNNLIIEVSGINHKDITNYLIDGVDLISTSSSITKSDWIDFSMRYIN